MRLRTMLSSIAPSYIVTSGFTGSYSEFSDVDRQLRLVNHVRMALIAVGNGALLT